MSWFTRLLGIDRKDDGTLALWREIYGGRASSSGKTINLQTALQVSTVLACARVIAEGLSQVPLKLYRTSKNDKTRSEAEDHPMYQVLYRRPNSFQTSFEYRETIGMHLVLTGNHYSFINRVRGEIAELIPIEPMRVTVKCASDYTLTYEVRGQSGQVQTFPAEAIWHLRGPSWSGWQGMDALFIARDVIGLSIALEESQARFHANGMQPSGAYSVEGTLKSEQYEQLRGWIEKEHAGSRNAGVPMILDRNAKWIGHAMTGVDSQHLESRKYQCEEICRGLRVMPIMVGFSDKTTTYASSEQMFLAHVVHTMQPWYERIEQSIEVNLLTPQDAKDGISAVFIAEGLLRGSMIDTGKYLSELVIGGIMVRNEARERIGLNPIDGLNEPLIPPRTTLESVPGAATPGGNKPTSPTPGATGGASNGF